MTGLRAPALSLLVVILLFETTSSFYLPGVAPTDYAKGEEMHVKVRTCDFMLPYYEICKMLALQILMSRIIMRVINK